MSGLAVQEIGVRFGGRQVLDGVSVTASPGIVTGVIGANGAGKTTLLRVLAGVSIPDAGRVLWAQTPLGRLDPGARARAVGYLPQRPQVDWPLSVREVAALGRLPYLPWWQAAGGGGADDAVAAALAACRLADMAERCVDTLSGGEFARAMLARLLAGRHRVLIADEPVADLDPPHRVDVMRILREEASRGACVVVALHDLALADAYCDRLWLLGERGVLADGPPSGVLEAHLLSRAYGAACNIRRVGTALAVTFDGSGDE